MPCAQRARGTKDPSLEPPHLVSQVANDPCGRPLVTFADGVQMDGHLCCLPHLQQKLGLLDVRPPYTFVP